MSTEIIKQFKYVQIDAGVHAGAYIGLAFYRCSNDGAGYKWAAFCLSESLAVCRAFIAQDEGDTLRPLKGVTLANARCVKLSSLDAEQCGAVNRGAAVASTLHTLDEARMKFAEFPQLIALAEGSVSRYDWLAGNPHADLPVGGSLTGCFPVLAARYGLEGEITLRRASREKFIASAANRSGCIKNFTTHLLEGFVPNSRRQQLDLLAA